MSVNDVLHLERNGVNVNSPQQWRYIQTVRISPVCIYCISRTHHTSMVNIYSWILSKIPTWPLHRDLTVVHGNCRRRMYELVNNQNFIPCYWDFFFYSMLIIIAVELEYDDHHVLRSKLIQHCEYRSRCFECPNPTHLFHRFLFLRPRSHRYATLSTYCHSWYHCVENCRRHRHPDTPRLISSSDAAENDEGFILTLNEIKCDSVLW